MMRLARLGLAVWSVVAAAAAGCVQEETVPAGPGCDRAACPPTGTDCVAPVCAGGQCAIANQIAGLSCSDHGGRVCDGRGKCIGCLEDADCPAQSVAECATPACGANHTCGTAPVMAGKPVEIQPVGSCQQLVCDGKGQVTSVADDTNKPTDPNPCIVLDCAMGKPTQTPVPGPCSIGGTVCGDPMGPNHGKCIGCNTDGDCMGGTFCSGAACTPQGANGAPCNAGDQCASGACVDGFCCNQAGCGGPASPCQGCAMAFTGQPNGTCATVKALASRPGACDANNGICADKPCACDGAGVANPDCLNAPGSSCTMGKQCASGSCGSMNNKCQ